MSLTGLPEAVKALITALPVETKAIFDQLGVNEEKLIELLDGLATKQESQLITDLKQLLAGKKIVISPITISIEDKTS